MLLEAADAVDSMFVFDGEIAKLGFVNISISNSNNGDSNNSGSSSNNNGGNDIGSSSSNVGGRSNNGGSGSRSSHSSSGGAGDGGGSGSSSISGISNGSSSSSSGIINRSNNGINNGDVSGSSINNNGSSSNDNGSSININNNGGDSGSGNDSSNSSSNSSAASGAHAACGQGIKEEGGGLQPSDRQVVQLKTVAKPIPYAAEVVDSKPQDVKKPPRIQRKVNDILRRMAEIGNLPYLGWGDLKVLLAAKMLEVVGAFEKESGFVRAKGGKDYVQQRDELVASLHKCDVAPCSVQRLAEILQEPRRHFSSTHKLMNALEKVLRVSSTVQPAVMPAEDEPPSSPLGASRKPSPGSAIIASIRLGSLKTAPPSQVERAVRELREETEEEDRAAMIICGMAGASAASAISVDEEMEADVEVGGGATAGACGRSGSKEGGGEEICVVSGPSMEEEKEKDEEGKKKRDSGDSWKGLARPASGDGSSKTGSGSSSGSGGSGSVPGGRGEDDSISRNLGTRRSSRIRNRIGTSSGIDVTTTSCSKRGRAGGDEHVKKEPTKRRKATAKRGTRAKQEGEAVPQPKPPPKVVKKQSATKEFANDKPATEKVATKTQAKKKPVKKEEMVKVEEGEAEVVKQSEKTEVS
eukprot:jgi/Undpi1/7153/HiC_scaffold_22.g09627.m1